MTTTLTPNRRWRRVLGAAATAAALVGLTSCGGSDAAKSGAQSAPSASKAEATELRLGYFANITHATPLIGVEKGIYAKDLGNTKLTTQIFNAGPAAVEAIFAGALDAAHSRASRSAAASRSRRRCRSRAACSTLLSPWVTKSRAFVSSVS